MGAIQRKPRQFLFLFSLVVSECYVAIAGALRGQIRGDASLVPFWAFALIQVSLIGFLVYRLRESRLAAMALALFCASYSLFALFVGGMAFTDSWL
jgi:hypothetical protein